MQNKQKSRRNFALTVTETQQISPNFQRITLQGDEIAHFGKESEGGYIKLLFTPQGGTDIGSLSEEERPLMRTYTIRQFDPASNQIVVDFVRHITSDLSCGFAARWAESAQVGDTISIAGPGKSQSLNQDADWVFLAADMTAIPALSVTLSQLNSDARGYAVVELASIADKPELQAPAGIELIWACSDQGETLADAVQAQAWLAGQCSVWCACEFESMRTLRQYFRNEKEIDREHIYISSYWKNGVSEDGHKVLKRADADADTTS
ncbi:MULTISPECIES: siderophore-interacting protein [Vibrio]|uniref:Siderophore-interacting protein n=1 Tax=Vibrio ostreae TaxID=2841925 RepID=A0A975U8E4_9VIBR|nr:MULTISPECIES: siderophore-interacting protein [Vibrio]QXO16317.1 siderophore-interacting protein [Vibrio ostreae]WGY45160.1 siderophore-interacting protein [Vibrio sp. ABG19]